MRRLVTGITDRYIKLEAKGNRGIKFKLYGILLKIYKKYEGKSISRKWFWFWGRFHLPPYWWRTKTFKVITGCLIVVTLGVLSMYLLNNRGAENIVNEIDTPILQKSDVSSDSSVTEIDKPKMIDGTLYIEGTQEYNFLRYDLSDAISKNSDTVGWLNVGYCDISYPLVQGTDNDYYLSHDFYKASNSHGWVFRDCRYSDTEVQNNVVLYGHNLMAGGMFSNLSKILDSKEPVYVQYQTRTATFIYEVVSVYTTEPVLSYIQMNFTKDELKQFHKDILSKNQWKYAPDVTLTDSDEILTLSTCYGDDRLAVHCRLIASEVL